MQGLYPQIVEIPNFMAPSLHNQMHVYFGPNISLLASSCLGVDASITVLQQQQVLQKSKHFTGIYIPEKYTYLTHKFRGRDSLFSAAAVTASVCHAGEKLEVELSMADINANTIKDIKSFNNVSVVAVAVTGAAVPLQPQIPGHTSFPVATPPASPGEMPGSPTAAVAAPAPAAKDYEDESLVFAAIMEKAGLYSLQVRKRCTNSQTLTQCYMMQILLDLQI